MLVVPELRRQALALNQDAVFHSVRLRDAIGYSLYVPMVTASLLTVVGAVCLLLAAAGLYSVISYAVSQRVQEFGVRMALGASPWDLVRMVARESLSLAAPGVLVGMAVALAAARGVGGMLVGVSAADPATFAGAAALPAGRHPARQLLAGEARRPRRPDERAAFAVERSRAPAVARAVESPRPSPVGGVS